MDTKSTHQNVQDAFLNTVRREKIAVMIYLMSGAKLNGRIKSFDKYSVILEASNQEQLIFKHAISTVVIQKAAHGPGGGHGPSMIPGPPQSPPMPAAPVDTSHHHQE